MRTFVILVPKKSDVAEPSHYHRISLCFTLYKICAKLMAKRMKPILRRLISPEQRAFIGGRSIIGYVMIVQEFMHDLRWILARCCFLAIKLDMERVYDRMS